MEDDSLSSLIVIALLIIVQGLLALIHAAISNARVRDMAEAHETRAIQVLSLASSANFTVTIQLATTLVRFSLAAVALFGLADPLVTEQNGNMMLVYAGILLMTAALSLILGDIVPEAVGSNYATPLSLLLIRPIKFLMLVLSPMVYVVLKISRILSAILGSDKLVNTVTEEEIMTLIDAGHTGGTIDEEEKEMIYSVLRLNETRVSEVMVPRIDIIGVEIKQNLTEAARLFVSSGYSRIPVFDESIDNIRGLLYAKDLLTHWKNGDDQTIQSLMRPAHYVPETKHVDELLRELQAHKVHMAIVVDEYGGTAGLATIENIIEEIIGDIQDEYDLNEEAEYEQNGPDEYTIDASMDLDDFNELLDVDLPTEDSDTLAGYIYTHFGRVPAVGETIDDPYLTMHVMSVEGHRIRKVHVIRKKRDTDEIEIVQLDDTDKSEEISKAG